MKTLWSVLVALCVLSPLSAQSVTLPKEVTGDPGSWVVVVPSAKDGGEVKWKLGFGLTQVRLDLLFPGQKSAGIVVQAPKGRYEVWAWNAKGDVASDLAVCVVVIGDSPPVPPGPIPPGPTPPGPVPPIPPGPQPGVNPFTDPNFHALVVYETADALPPLQRAILTGTDIRNYLKTKSADGYRFLDKDADVTESPKWVKDAMARPRTSLPWIMLGEGEKGFEGPLPATISETLTILKKIGG